MGRYLTNTFGSPDVEYDVTESNYMDVYNALKSQQGLIHMTPSDPDGWDASGHVDVFGIHKGTFDLRSGFQSNGAYQPHMLKYLQGIAQKPGRPAGKVRVWRLEGKLPKPSKGGFWNWLKRLFS